MLKTLKRNTISWKVSIWTFPKNKTKKELIGKCQFERDHLQGRPPHSPGLQETRQLAAESVLIFIFNFGLMLVQQLNITLVVKVQTKTVFVKCEVVFLSAGQIQRQRQLHRKRQTHYFGGGGWDKDGLGEVVLLSIGRGCERKTYFFYILRTCQIHLEERELKNNEWYDKDLWEISENTKTLFLKSLVEFLVCHQCWCLFISWWSLVFGS